MMKPTSPTEVEDIISKCNTNKGTGPNSILQPLMNSVKKSIIPLSNMFDMSFQTGQCLTFLKLSSVIPVYKKTHSYSQTVDQFPYCLILTRYLKK